MQERRNACKIVQSVPGKHQNRVQKRGRKHIGLKATLDGIWWILCNGSMWNQLPGRFGKWNSVYRAFNRWSHSGLITEILAEVVELSKEETQKIRALDGSHCKAHQDACRSSCAPLERGLGKTKGGRNTKISAVVNSYGKALNLEIVPDNLHDSKCAKSTLGKDSFASS